MQVIETDYLVVGAGASGMAFVDALTAHRDVEVLMVDRRHRPGGHWLDAYPFVRLHQPSAIYGVASRRLGDDRIDETGPNAGFYERATAAAICDYYGRVLDDQMIPSGKVRFLGLHDYRGQSSDGHHIVSLATGAQTVVKVRQRLVDATYVQSEIPSRRRPAYAIDHDARVIPPNALVDLDSPPSGFTIIGAGKTAMDACCWLIDEGVDPDRIRWIRPRDAWVFDRATVQPLDLVASWMRMQACWLEALAEASDGNDFARRLEAQNVLMRIDPDVEPQVWRGATVSRLELKALQSIERVERGRVLGIGADRIVLDTGEIAITGQELHVDCTAPGLPAKARRPIFEPGQITVENVEVGSATLGAAILGRVEALPDDDTEKNRLCPPVSYSGNAADLIELAYSGLVGTVARSSRKDVGGWFGRCRLNPVSAGREHREDPDVIAARARMLASVLPALQRGGYAVASS